jgi:hypothetical protein
MDVPSNRWEKWERTRSRGRERFVWLAGVCCLGLGTGCLSAVLLAAELHSRRHPAPWIALLPLHLGPIAGYAWGRIVWEFIEAKYLAERAARQRADEQTASLEALAREVRDLREALRR